MRHSPANKYYLTLALCLVSLLLYGKFVVAGIGDELAEEAKRIAANKEKADVPATEANTPPTPPKPKPVPTYALTVKTEPTNATVSIRNIQPKYRDGIQLAPGKYHIRVSASGYQTQDKWIELGKANKTVSFALKKLPPPPEPVVAAPVTPAPAPVAQPQPSYPPATTSQNRIAGRYIDHGNGTITDTQTRLMWKKCSEGQSGNECKGDVVRYTWNDAMSRFKSGVGFAGYNDWRMPTKDELKTLVYCSNGTKTPLPDFKDCGDWLYQQPTINLQVFPNTLNTWYWSASSDANGDVWFVLFNEGYAGIDYEGNDNRVRLVRSGQ